MVDDRPTQEVSQESMASLREAGGDVFALVIAFSREEPARVGEVLLVPGPRVLGRGGARPDDPLPRALPLRQRPGHDDATGPLIAERLSRLQLRLEPRAESLLATSLGRLRMRVNGVPAASGEVVAGDVLALEEELVLLVARRPPTLPRSRSWPAALRFAFGAADPGGLVGEGPAAWELRDQIAFAAKAGAHALVHGASGAGKELAAQGIHALSARAGKALVARNAATFPEGLIDAELFGNVKNYPNPGMPERLGLIGEADGTTLFLDEIGELPSHLQAHLLRVLDAKGEYQRLGEAKLRRADLRLVATTNRDPESLKHDLAARLTLRLEVPPLDERREDLPLLLAHQARKAAAKLGLEPPVTGARLVEALLRHPFKLNVRELDQIVWQSLSESRPGRLELTPRVEHLLKVEEPAEEEARHRPEPTKDELSAALAQAAGNVTRAARSLGLKNRYVLYRLMRKHGLVSPEGA
jgi:two-component system nitrogen regulation response regulator GlnG/two-component system response regulator HydG